MKTIEQISKSIANIKIQLSQENQLRLAIALINPPEPNAALQKAAVAYDKASINSQ